MEGMSGELSGGMALVRDQSGGFHGASGLGFRARATRAASATWRCSSDRGKKHQTMVRTQICFSAVLMLI